ncbi:MAG: tagaturonate epimerase family protein [Armatimonadota bacterium]|nr:tagaturonate epimerase family protein [Armatimonadota bacterium]
MQINGITIDPAVNPAVLDTLTWDEAAIKSAIANSEVAIQALTETVKTGGADKLRSVEQIGELKVFAPSVVSKDNTIYALAALKDGQRVFVSFGETSLLPAIWEKTLAGMTVRISPVNVDTAKAFVTSIAPQFGPKALGATPRIGVGNRQSTMVWPGIYEALRKTKITAEIIQNSAYRELAPVSFILSPPANEVTYLPGHGSLNIGHTGSSIEGLWLTGVATAIEHGFGQPYGADLDHIPVKTAGPEGVARAKALIDAGRHFTFFTLDTSALFNLDALKLTGAELDAAFAKAVPAEAQADLLKSYKDNPANVNAEYWLKSETEVKQMAAAYWVSIEAATELYRHIVSLKQGEPFDFEFSLDEGPEITEPVEQTFVLNELKKRGVSVQFIAPNVGFEKRVDYRKPDGLPGLTQRVRRMHEIAQAYGALLDFHSGSDKAPLTYQTISRAAGGNVKLKVSGKLQLIFSEVAADLDPAFFNEWWDWTLGSAKAEANRGSEVAKTYIAKVEERRAAEGASFKKSPKDLFFTDFSFGMVGAKDEKGQFMFRDRFYKMSGVFKEEYTRRTVEYLVKLAQDLELVR